LSLRERLQLLNKDSGKEPKMNPLFNENIGVGNGISKQDLAIIQGKSLGAKRRRGEESGSEGDEYVMRDEFLANKENQNS